MAQKGITWLLQMRGSLQGRAICIDSDLRLAGRLSETLVFPQNRAYYEGQKETLAEWKRYNERLLGAVDQIIRGIENEEE